MFINEIWQGLLTALFGYYMNWVYQSNNIFVHGIALIFFFGGTVVFLHGIFGKRSLLEEEKKNP
jgi:hypothetical protein